MMMGKIGLVAGLGMLLLGCAGERPSQSHGATEPHEPTAINEVVTAYEAVRSQLANDQTTDLSPAFERFRIAALTASKADISEAVADHLQKLGKVAARGAKVEADSLQVTREAFAEASEHLVGAIASEPSLAHGLSIFECPMTKGYPKWLQASDAKGNPYMGKGMQFCGVESQWK